MKKKRDLNGIILIATVFIGFLVFGLSENIKGPAIPRIQDNFSLNEAQLGMLLALNSIGYLIACTYTPFLSKKIGLKNTTILCFLIMAFSGILIGMAPNYIFFSGSYFIMYLGNGMLEIALGVIAAIAFTKNTGTMMNLSHFFYGLSSMIAPLIATKLMSSNLGGQALGWRGMYLIVLLLSLIPIIPTLMGKFPKSKNEESVGIKESFKEMIKDKKILLITFILSFGVTCEMTVGGWLVNYLEKAQGFSGEDASKVLMGFFFFFMLARLVLGPIIDKLGFVKSLLIVSTFAGISIIIGILLGKGATLLLMLSGIGIAPIYPTVMAIIAKEFREKIEIAMSFVLTFMGIAIVIGNLLVGVVVDLCKMIFSNIYGIELGIKLAYSGGFIFIGGCSLICALGSLRLLKVLRSEEEEFLVEME
ncbi:MFS transporter [Clostridium sp. LIBA-8841]|uniref:MFS transporter n=1 Tax=Clostridium sp. LIBA-8841 TaxID=2987530 RepID=UPI002AC63755|nr:MFS transporter [Clostridium sp. LIBA-8841]MDZ5253892.1 MFS transporter [Clostridium sp. LIBA-8841]